MNPSRKKKSKNSAMVHANNSNCQSGREWDLCFSSYLAGIKSMLPEVGNMGRVIGDLKMVLIRLSYFEKSEENRYVGHFNQAGLNITAQGCSENDTKERLIRCIVHVLLNKEPEAQASDTTEAK